MAEVEVRQREEAIGFPGFRERQDLKVRKRRHPLMLVVHLLIFAGALFAVYQSFLKDPIRKYLDERHDTAAYATENVDVEVHEVSDPSGMWKTIPIAMSIANNGPRNVHKLEIAARFFDEDGEFVWETDSTRNVRVETEDEIRMTWRCAVGGEIGSDIKKASRVRTAEVTVVRAWTRAAE